MDSAHSWRMKRYCVCSLLLLASLSSVEDLVEGVNVQRYERHRQQHRNEQQKAEQQLHRKEGPPNSNEESLPSLQDLNVDKVEVHRQQEPQLRLHSHPRASTWMGADSKGILQFSGSGQPLSKNASFSLVGNSAAVENTFPDGSATTPYSQRLFAKEKGSEPSSSSAGFERSGHFASHRRGIGGSRFAKRNGGEATNAGRGATNFSGLQKFGAVRQHSSHRTHGAHDAPAHGEGFLEASSAAAVRANGGGAGSALPAAYRSASPAGKGVHAKPRYTTATAAETEAAPAGSAPAGASGRVSADARSEALSTAVASVAHSSTSAAHPILLTYAGSGNKHPLMSVEQSSEVTIGSSAQRPAARGGSMFALSKSATGEEPLPSASASLTNKVTGASPDPVSRSLSPAADGVVPTMASSVVSSSAAASSSLQGAATDIPDIYSDHLIPPVPGGAALAGVKTAVVAPLLPAAQPLQFLLNYEGSAADPAPAVGYNKVDMAPPIELAPDAERVAMTAVPLITERQAAPAIANPPAAPGSTPSIPSKPLVGGTLPLLTIPTVGTPPHSPASAPPDPPPRPAGAAAAAAGPPLSPGFAAAVVSPAESEPFSFDSINGDASASGYSSIEGSASTLSLPGATRMVAAATPRFLPSPAAFVTKAGTANAPAADVRTAVVQDKAAVPSPSAAPTLTAAPAAASAPAAPAPAAPAPAATAPAVPAAASPAAAAAPAAAGPASAAAAAGPAPAAAAAGPAPAAAAAGPAPAAAAAGPAPAAAAGPAPAAAAAGPAPAAAPAAGPAPAAAPAAGPAPAAAPAAGPAPAAAPAAGPAPAAAPAAGPAPAAAPAAGPAPAPAAGPAAAPAAGPAAGPAAAPAAAAPAAAAPAAAGPAAAPGAGAAAVALSVPAAASAPSNPAAAPASGAAPASPAASAAKATPARPAAAPPSGDTSAPPHPPASALGAHGATVGGHAIADAASHAGPRAPAPASDASNGGGAPARRSSPPTASPPAPSATYEAPQLESGFATNGSIGKACFNACHCWPVWSLGILLLMLNLTSSFVAFYNTASLFSRGLHSSQFYRGGGYWLLGVAALGFATGGLIGGLVPPACWAGCLYLGGFLMSLFLSFVLIGRRGALLGSFGGVGAGGVIGHFTHTGMLGIVMGMLLGLLVGIVIGFAPICRDLKINERYVRASLGAERRLSRRGRYIEDHLDKTEKNNALSSDRRTRYAASPRDTHISESRVTNEFLLPASENNDVPAAGAAVAGSTVSVGNSTAQRAGVPKDAAPPSDE